MDSVTSVGCSKALKKKKKTITSFSVVFCLMRLPDYHWMNEALYKYLIKFTWILTERYS